MTLTDSVLGPGPSPKFLGMMEVQLINSELLEGCV